MAFLDKFKMKKLITLCALVAVVFATSSAQAVPSEPTVTFDIEGALIGGIAPDYVVSANQRVTDYMTSEYGSSVTATGAAAWRNAESSPLDLDWPGKTDTDQWLRTYGSQSVTPGYFQISFDDVPITSMSGDFHVFVETGGDDFVVRAYDSTYGDRYNPNSSALIAEQSWNFGTGSDVFDIDFSSPVSLLVFSDGGWYDIAIDNLTVTSVPEPATILLLGLGGILLRRRK